MSMNTNGETSGLDVRDLSSLRWSGNFELDITRGGDLNVDLTGSLNRNSNTAANVRFTDDAFYDMVINGTVDLAELLFDDDMTVNISGAGSIYLNDDLQFEGDDATVTNDLSGTFTVNDNIYFVNLSTGNVFTNNQSVSGNDRLYFQDDNNSVINTGNLSLSVGIYVDNAGDDNNTLNNSGSITYGSFDNTNATFNVVNSGTINQSGNFSNIVTASAFVNDAGATWNWSGTTFDPDLGTVLDATATGNTFNYSNAGAQNVIPTTYYDVTFSTSGTKTAQGDLVVQGDMTASGSAVFDDNGNQTTFSGGDNGILDGVTTLTDVVINKSAASIALANNLTIDGSLTLTNGNIDIDDYDLDLSGGTISGGSVSSFVETSGNGELMRAVDGVGIAFPVGRSGDYTPVTLGYNSGTVNVFSVRICDGINVLGTCVNTSLLADVVGKTYMIEDGVGGANVDVTLTWNDSDELSALTTVNMVHFTGTEWEIVGADLDGSGNTITATGITSFSPFGVESATAAPLPVTLASFEGQLKNNAVELNWVTATEINNDYFIVEKSLDGNLYKQLTRIEGNGNSDKEIAYGAIDKNPAAGNNYYRLVQYDFNGDSEIHGPINVHVDVAGEINVSFYPVPNQGHLLNLEVSPLERDYLTELRIINMQGQVVFQESILIDHVTGLAEQLKFNEPLQQGIYIIEIAMSTPYIKKFIVE